MPNRAATWSHSLNLRNMALYSSFIVSSVQPEVNLFL
jgi:hypothetical protein